MKNKFRKILTFIIIICTTGLILDGISNYHPPENKQETSINFYDKHFYFGWMKINTKNLAGTNNIGEYMKMTFWLSFFSSLIIVLISIIPSLSSINSLIGRSFVIFYHLILWLFLIFLGIFYANLGPGWFISCGLITVILTIFMMMSLNENYFIPFSKTISKYFDTIKKYKTIYNNIKNQEIWNQ